MSGMRFYSSFTEVSLHLPSSDSRYITHFHRSTFLFQRISLHWTQNAYWVCLSLSVCLCVSMLSVVCHAYRNNLIRLRWLACSVRRRHPPPAGDEQTFIINKEDYLIKPCSLQLSISLLVVTVPVLVIWIRWGQVVTCSGQWPNWPNTCRHVKCDYIGLKSANHLKVSFSEILLDIN